MPERGLPEKNGPACFRVPVPGSRKGQGSLWGLEKGLAVPRMRPRRAARPVRPRAQPAPWRASRGLRGHVTFGKQNG